MAALDHPTVIVIVFIFIGCVIFVTFLAAALFCFLKKRKKSVQESGMIHLDEHKKIKKAIVEGPHGIDTVALSVEDDIHIHGDIKRARGLVKVCMPNLWQAMLQQHQGLPMVLCHQHNLEHKA